jgi:hypothetical protein
MAQTTNHNLVVPERLEPARSGALDRAEIADESPGAGSGNVGAEFVVRQEPADIAPALDTITGILHVYVAFDWGEEVHMEHVRQLVPIEPHLFPRRRRTPSSIAYRPPPLRFALGPVPIELRETGPLQATAEATVFDFAAVSVALHVPFQLAPSRLSRLASELAQPDTLVQAARNAIEPLHKRLLPAIERPLWGDLSEEYFVFELPPSDALLARELLDRQAPWLAGLVRLDAQPLSPPEIGESIRLSLSYRPDDLFVADWAAAVLIDRDCDETLQVIEFANLQLLEYREIDNRLDDRLATAYGFIHSLARSRLPFWRFHTRQVRALGELKVEANSVFERTGNALKLVGDQYLARAYRLLATRFHLDAWEQSIKRSLDVLESVYRAVSDQAAAYRTEFLEAIIVLLILFEIAMALLSH